MVWIAGLAACLALAAGIDPAGAAGSVVEPPAVAVTGRRAVIDLDRTPRRPTALDSIPHPWPGVATLLSAAGTAAPVLFVLDGPGGNDGVGFVLAMLGVEVVSPAAGHLYAGVPRQALRGILIRATGFALAAGAAASTNMGPDGMTGEFTWAHVALGAGTLIVGVGALIDVLTVGHTVERHNEALVRARLRTGIGLAPDRRTPVLVVAARF